MKTRSISATVFVIVVVGFFLLRQYVDYRLFQILTAFFTFVATFEVVRALKPFSEKYTDIMATVLGGLFIASYAIGEYVIKRGFGVLIALDNVLIGSLIIVIYCLIRGSDIKKTLISVFPVVYPSVLMMFLFMVNDFTTVNLAVDKGFIATLLVFVISPCADTMAYLVGMTTNKILKGKAKKMCPNLSPKKTWAGAVGGLIGGAIGGFLVWVVFRPTTGLFYLPVFYAVVGLFVSILTEAGDLFESYVKRRAGIKDMGKIMPGHGGIMDRIDGISFASFGVFWIFAFI